MDLTLNANAAWAHRLEKQSTLHMLDCHQQCDINKLICNVHTNNHCVLQFMNRKTYCFKVFEKAFS